MAVKANLSLVILLFSVLFLCAGLALAKQDPELKQCKHQCRQQWQFDQKQRESCEQKCEDYYREKREREEQEGGRGREEVSVEDPKKQLRRCKEQCERQEGEERALCHRRCEQTWGREKGRGKGEYRREEEEEEEEERGERNPYVFEQEHFTTRVKTEEGRVEVLPKFTQRSKLLRGIENYRVAVLIANPHTFVTPTHFDADVILYVAKGRGTISQVREHKRESFNVQRGDIVRIRAGTPVYLINRDENEKLYIVKLLQTVNLPGHYEEFYGPGGENPETFYRAFSWDVLEAAFKTGRDKLERIFREQDKGSIIKASREQIQAMSHEEEGGGTVWPFTGESRSSFNLLNKRPSQSNDYGRLFEADKNDYRPLQDLNLRVSFANITQGSMTALFYNSRSTKIAIVTEGEGRFEMACPHLAASGSMQHHQGGQGSQGGRRGGPRYQKVSARLTRGTVFIVPAGHPAVTIASRNNNLQVVCFENNAHDNIRYILTGRRNIVNEFEREAKELAFNVPAGEVERIFRNQQEEFFFPGPSRQQERGRAFE